MPRALRRCRTTEGCFHQLRDLWPGADGRAEGAYVRSNVESSAELVDAFGRPVASGSTEFWKSRCRTAAGLLPEMCRWRRGLGGRLNVQIVGRRPDGSSLWRRVGVQLEVGCRESALTTWPRCGGPDEDCLAGASLLFGRGVRGGAQQEPEYRVRRLYTGDDENRLCAFSNLLTTGRLLLSERCLWWCRRGAGSGLQIASRESVVAHVRKRDVVSERSLATQPDFLTIATFLSREACSLRCSTVGTGA